MVEFFIKLGSTNKKLLLPAIASVLYIILNIIDITTNMEKLHIIFDSYSRGTSYVLIIIVPLVQKCCERKTNKDINIENKKKSKCTKKSFLHFFILYLIFILFFGVFIYLHIYKTKNPEGTEDFQMSHYHGLCSEEAIEIIFILIVSKIILKSKLYIHHYIGLLIFIIFSFGIDILLKLSIFKPKAIFYAIYFVYLLLDSIYITYEKYMMDKLYYSPFSVVFAVGFLFIITPTIFVILISIYGNNEKFKEKYKIESFDDYFKAHDYKKIIIHVVYLTCFRYVLNILKILTIYYFTPNHIYTTYIVIKLVDYLIKKEDPIRFFSIILFIFQFLGLLIYLEIIELNFLKLNKNTIRNIKEREIIEDENLLNDNEENGSYRNSIIVNKGKKINKVEISPGYTVESEMAIISRDSSEAPEEKRNSFTQNAINDE